MKEELSQEVAEARRRFEAECEHLRPDLHRFCTRMTGSPCDGEDVLQDALVLAFYRLPELRDGAALRGWLFRIAHNKCIDFLRARRESGPLAEEDDAGESPSTDEVLDEKRHAGQVLGAIVTGLPPRERAAVVLKDVLDASLEEVAEITGASVGAVKAALHRGREKLAAWEAPGHAVAIDARHRPVVERYIAAFNSRDWSGVRALLAEDARLEVIRQGEVSLRDSCYFTNYGRLAQPWKLELAWVDGVESIVHFREIDGAWVPRSVLQLRVADGAVTAIRDYVHVEYQLQSSTVSAS